MRNWNMYKRDLIMSCKRNEPERFSQFYNRDCSLNRYSFGCGYVEIYKRIADPDNNYLELYQDGCYHVQGRIADTRIWESFDLLTEARQYVKTLKRNNP